MNELPDNLGIFDPTRARRLDVAMVVGGLKAEDDFASHFRAAMNTKPRNLAAEERWPGHTFVYEQVCADKLLRDILIDRAAATLPLVDYR